MIDNFQLAFDGAWHVLIAALALGAGVPAMFALGIRALSLGGASEEGGSIRPIGRVLGTLCFAVVVLAIALGITFIVAKGFGKELDFSGIIPTLIDK